MATYEIIQPDGAATTYNIGNGAYCQLQYPGGISGIGIPSIVRDIQRHPNIEGAIDHGYKLEPREINLNLYYSVASAAAADARRDAIYKIFRPFDLASHLKITRDDGTVRQIDVHTIGITDLPMGERVGHDQAFNVRLLAPNPIWYHPTQVTLSLTPSVPSPWGSNFNYAGAWETYPIIKVYGAVTGFSLSSTIVTEGDTTVYSLGTWNIPAGDVLTFDLRPGYKTIKNAAGVSQLSSGTAENTFIFLYGFRLFPDPIEPGGVNQMVGTYSTKDANHKVEMTFYNRYLGL